MNQHDSSDDDFSGNNNSQSPFRNNSFNNNSYYNSSYGGGYGNFSPYRNYGSSSNMGFGGYGSGYGSGFSSMYGINPLGDSRNVQNDGNPQNSTFRNDYQSLFGGMQSLLTILYAGVGVINFGGLFLRLGIRIINLMGKGSWKLLTLIFRFDLAKKLFSIVKKNGASGLKLGNKNQRFLHFLRIVLIIGAIFFYILQKRLLKNMPNKSKIVENVADTSLKEIFVEPLDPSETKIIKEEAKVENENQAASEKFQIEQQTSSLTATINTDLHSVIIDTNLTTEITNINSPPVIFNTNLIPTTTNTELTALNEQTNLAPTISNTEPMNLSGKNFPSNDQGSETISSVEDNPSKGKEIVPYQKAVFDKKKPWLKQKSITTQQQ